MAADTHPLESLLGSLQQSQKKRRRLDDKPFSTQPHCHLPGPAASNAQQWKYTSMGSSLPVQSPPLWIPQQDVNTSSQTPSFAWFSGGNNSVAQARPHAIADTNTPRFASGPIPFTNQQALAPVLPSSSYETGGASINPSKRRSASSKKTATADLRVPIMPDSQLIRTSILEQSQQSSINREFNPYALYPTAKAKLVLQGDLMPMTQDWTSEENTTQRRLIEFTRAQAGNVVTASFKPVKLEERTPNSTCVSCIYWRDRDEYFVTSVDAITLLEGLIAARFTVEEKNRIRRNLEGYKPLTVSKHREDTDAFFRLIMGFPAPKPRNIEKDVKVFPWAKLTEALNKVFDKYSASSASTASFLATPACTVSQLLAESYPPINFPVIFSHWIDSPALLPAALPASPQNFDSDNDRDPTVVPTSEGVDLPISIVARQEYPNRPLQLSYAIPTVVDARRNTVLDVQQQRMLSLRTEHTGYTVLGRITPLRDAGAWGPTRCLTNVGGATASNGSYMRSAKS